MSIILMQISKMDLFAQKVEINPFGSIDDFREFIYKEAMLKPDSVYELGIRNEYIQIPKLNIDSLKLFQFKNLKVITVINYHIDVNKSNTLQTMDVLSIRFSKCQLIKIPRGIFKNMDLEYLSIHDNKLMSIPKEIKKLKKLKRLVLSNNQIESIPFRQLKRLRFLIEFNLWDNPIVENKSQEKRLNKLYKIIDKHRVKQGIPKLYTVPPIE